MNESESSSQHDYHRNSLKFPPLSVTIAPSRHIDSAAKTVMNTGQHCIKLQQQQHKLPTPISPTSITAQHFVGQFSVKSAASTPTTAATAESPAERDRQSNKLFTCTECDQAFNRAHNLTSHKATHSASKPYQCVECEKQFLRLHDLKRHQKLHTGERPYECPVCQRSFSRLDALNRHRKTEGGSACLKSSHSIQNNSVSIKRLSPPAIPGMMSQWQMSTSLSANSNTTITATTTTSPAVISTTTITPTTPTLLATATHASSNSNTINATSNVNTTTTAAAMSTLLPAPPSLLVPKPNNKSPMPTEPSPTITTPLPFILPFSQQEEEIDALRQRIHDLEIENRVLRSLLCNKEDAAPSKRKRSP